MYQRASIPFLLSSMIFSLVQRMMTNGWTVNEFNCALYLEVISQSTVSSSKVPSTECGLKKGAGRGERERDEWLTEWSESTLNARQLITLGIMKIIHHLGLSIRCWTHIHSLTRSHFTLTKVTNNRRSGLNEKRNNFLNEGVNKQSK